MATKVFIDGEAGTTGLQIRQRLEGRAEFDLLAIDPARRKDPSARRELLNAADVVILCLPDAAAREAVGLIENPQTRVIDASTAYRTAPDWTYGFPEMTRTQAKAIAAALRVSNPGCYPTGFIALVRPLVEAGLLPRHWPVTVNAISGYSGGGRGMITAYETPEAADYIDDAYRPYALGLAHKHVPEMQRHGGLDHPPLFAPAVARFAQGMLVAVPLQTWSLPGRPRRRDLEEALAAYYEGSAFVRVVAQTGSEPPATLNPQALNGTNRLDLYVLGNDSTGQVQLLAVLDNLGKGASGAAVQNLNLMSGLAEDAGL